MVWLSQISSLWDQGKKARLDAYIDNFLEKWDFNDDNNPYLEEATTREASRVMWRTYYKSKAVHDLRQVATRGRPPVRFDQLDDPMPEQADVEEFITIIQ